MKHGKNPTRKQKIMIKKVGLNPDNWLVVKNTTDQLCLINRESGRTKEIPYG
ncbi:hypothetical protein Sgly_0752 [Syntrophobotulus glycolicus DSM 8271]|uniref:DUF6906 domain-containing protein n=1 Tax=Syntrophobotulus glycolicus (strain DSM 8271 / FlGlyR) TaxID=645991 RepID=F0T0P4_SYNGF|nr:hypothetical protein [Syntrophobotulus glycolicus]ADY55109.1 hypothetical protein Sgly_0752 [Syntrophobotulus glycolicus DSM 8271]